MISPVPVASILLWATLALAHESQHPIVETRLAQPGLGFGTWQLNPENATEAVSLAIQHGYRQIDGAAIYRNEIAVGKGIADGLKKANLTRDQIWVTSKLWNDHHSSPALAAQALEKTLKDLDLEYLDLYLMHWPPGPVDPKTGIAPLDYVETWKSMNTLPKTKVRNLGICNFSPAQLETLIAETGVKPFAHQMELHPYLQQSAWIATHKVLGIAVTAYSPLAHSNDGQDGPPPLLKNEVLVDIAKEVNCSAAQVAISWSLSRGLSVIPKSSHEKYIIENFEATECQLGAAQLAKVDLIQEQHVKRFIDPSKSWGVELFEGLEH